MPASRATAVTSIIVLVAIWLVTLALLSVPARAQTDATIEPSLSPNRLGAKAALTFKIEYSGGAFGVPTPVRRSVLKFPRGLTLDIPELRSCSVSRLRSRGPSGCPARSRLGSGHALLEAHAGTETFAESATLLAFLGPTRRDLTPTVEVFAHGYTPLDQVEVLSGEVLSAEPPYGEELVMSIPPIPTLVFEPDASVVTFSLTIGAKPGRETSDSVLVPSSCPAGGFPFAGEFTYADGSTGEAHATDRCPR